MGIGHSVKRLSSIVFDQPVQRQSHFDRRLSRVGIPKRFALSPAYPFQQGRVLLTHNMLLPKFTHLIYKDSLKFFGSVKLSRMFITAASIITMQSSGSFWYPSSFRISGKSQLSRSTRHQTMLLRHG